jgi:hypothetical protein
MDGREVNSPKGVQRLDFDDPEQDAAGDFDDPEQDAAGSGPHDGHDANEAIDGVQPTCLALDTDADGASDIGGSLTADDPNFHQCLLDAADHDDRLAENGDRGRDISPPATLGDLCELESFF